MIGGLHDGGHTLAGDSALTRSGGASDGDQTCMQS
jgi:hypothetical protein